MPSPPSQSSVLFDNFIPMRLLDTTVIGRRPP